MTTYKEEVTASVTRIVVIFIMYWSKRWDTLIPWKEIEANSQNGSWECLEQCIELQQMCDYEIESGIEGRNEARQALYAKTRTSTP